MSGVAIGPLQGRRRFEPGGETAGIFTAQLSGDGALALDRVRAWFWVGDPGVGREDPAAL